MRLRPYIFCAMLLAATVSAAEGLYKWVDERGVTHYSDRKPDDPKNAGKVMPVAGSLSVYSPDKSLLRAVEIARQRASEPVLPSPTDYVPRPYVAPVAMQPPPSGEPCPYADCAEPYYSYTPAPVYGFRRRPALYAQAVLPPGATAGTVNSPGIIPGNTGTRFGVPTPPPGLGPRRASFRSGPFFGPAPLR